MASNATVHADIDFGNFSDWIEIYNNSDQDINLTGYYLSDDYTNLFMWSFQSGTVVPAHDFLLVYADGFGHGNHTNFKLEKDGEILWLVDSTATIIDSLSFPSQLTDISFGRNSENLQNTGYFEVPTPGEINGTQVYAGISSPPWFSLEGGFYSGPQSIEITTARPGTTIHYTLDGTEPDSNSETITGLLSVTQNTVLRIKTIEENFLPSPSVTQSYFIDVPQNLPVISLVTDPGFLFDEATGIYVQGTGGIPGYCTSVPHNVNQDWERPINIELFEMDGTIGLNQMAGVKIFGGCSRVRYPAKSLALYARKQYEKSSFNYQLFPDKNNERYETFILRASADDQPFTLLRDPLTQMLVKDIINVDMQAYRPVVVYINGAYWGIHNLREKINEHYPADNYGVNPDSVDMIKTNPENSWNVIAGSADHYNTMMDYLRNNDITQAPHYEYMKTQMDMDEYINYQIIQIFFGGRDWPGNNIKFWRSREANHNKWRWVLYDLDHMFKEYFSDIMEEATEVDCNCSWPNPPWSTYLFRRLLENNTFKNEFLHRFTIYSSTHFSRDRVHRYIDDLQAVIAPEIPRHIERWGGQKTDLPDNTWVSPIFNSVAAWNNNVQVMRDFTDKRHEMAIKHVNEYFGVSGFAGLATHVQPTGTGRIKIGETVLNDPEFSGDFTSGEVLSFAYIEEPKYHFSHWQVDHLATRDTGLIIQGDQWKYFISWDKPASNWTTVSYNDNQWETGKAQLGYGDGDEETVVSYGDNPNDKIITTWFRKKFFIEDTDLYKRFTLKLLRDDGARIHLNGKEVIRDNMQRWWIDSYATSEDTIAGIEESTWYSFVLNPAMFRNGENVLAVEIHQASGTSSDISFDLELLARSNQPGTQELIYDNAFDLNLLDDTDVTAVLIKDTSILEQVFINEWMASNKSDHTDEFGEFDDWIELYNDGDEAVDLAGFLLSDELPAIDPWQFPDNQSDFTTIPPNGFLVVFADKDPEQGALHADFKLSKDGEEIALLKKIGEDTLVVDHVVFGPQYGNVSSGRTPDASPVFNYMTEATPGTSNLVAAIEPQPIEEIPGDVTLYPVPTYGPLFVRFNETLANQNLPVEIRVFSMTGSMVYATHQQSSSLLSISLENQSKGLYIIQILAGEHRFVKRVILY